MARKSNERPERSVNNSSHVQALPVRERLKAWLSLVQSVLTITAIIVGAAWFAQQGDPFAKATISHEITDRSIGEGHRWIHIAITIANPGKTMLALETGTIRIQQIKPLDSRGSAVLANAVSNGNANSVVSKEHYVVIWPAPVEEYAPKLHVQIEPGESDTLNYEFVIPAEIKTIKVYSDFSERNTGRIWKTYRRIVNPDREGLRWHQTTIYDPKS